MNTEQIFSLKNPWFTGTVGALLLFAIIAAAIGFMWVPMNQTDRNFAGLWDAICRAAGVPVSSREQAMKPTNIPTEVVVTPQMMGAVDQLSVGRGATLAQQCTMCHGIRGMSQANTPNLAGQLAPAIYKQLRDYKSGHRKNDIMAAMVANLKDQDMRDLSFYYAYLPRIPEPAPLRQELKAPVIIQIGAPMRNIAPCASCHGGSDNKTGTPLLDGEPAPYLVAQLRAFADGTRRNDIHGQMRNIARHMTPAEIEEAAQYYASR